MTSLLDAPGRTGALHRPPVTARPSFWRRPRTLDLLLATLSSLVTAGVIAVGIGHYPAAGGDEGIYTDQAFAVLRGHITPYTYTYDHPFLGWVQLAVLSWFTQLTHIGGQMTVINDRAVMVVYAFATLMLTYGIGHRLGMRRVFSVLAVLLLGLSPLYIVDARQVFLDNIAMAWVLGAIYLALSPARRQWTYGLAGVMMAIGILSKETVLLFLPAVLYLVWTRSYRPIRLMSLATFMTFGTMLVLVYPLFALLRNELLPGSTHVSLWTNGVMYQLATRAGSGSLWQHGSARLDLLNGWLYYDHVLVYGGAVAALAVLASKRLRVIGIAYLFWALPVIKPGGYLPAMYVIASLPFAALAIAGSFDAFQNACRKLRASTVLAGALTAALLVSVLSPVGAQYLRNHRKVSTAVNSVSFQEQALTYLKTHVSARDNVLTDDVFWTDLVRAGHGSVANPWRGTISYYQFDLDPVSSNKNLPEGWEDINYVVVTNPMLSNIKNLGLTKLAQTISHSTVLASFGTGDAMVQIRKVQTTKYNSSGG